MLPHIDYQINLDILKTTSIIPKEFQSEVVPEDYRGLPYEKEFQTLFDFYQGNLIQHYKYGIEPGIAFFNTIIDVNAIAACWNSYYIISISKGAIHFLLKSFYENEDILRFSELEIYKKATSKSDYPINELMYQICGHYIFYHELGHLIQNSNRSFLINELIGFNKSFNLNDHIKEYDADMFSAICIGTHQYQYITKWCPGISNQEAELLISLISASIFIFLLSFKYANKPLYFESNTHPHPMIRIFCISYFMIDYIEVISNYYNKLTINKGRVFNNSIKIANILSRSIFKSTIMESYISNVRSNEEKIVAYHHKLIDLVKNWPESAFNKRNNLSS